MTLTKVPLEVTRLKQKFCLKTGILLEIFEELVYAGVGGY